MFDTGLETTIVITAMALCLAHGWYLNTRLQHVQKKLDRILEQFDGLRGYLYEIDAQFDDERQLLGELDESLEKGSVSFAGVTHMELTKQKEEQGRRARNSPFFAEQGSNDRRCFESTIFFLGRRFGPAPSFHHWAALAEMQ